MRVEEPVGPGRGLSCMIPEVEVLQQVRASDPGDLEGVVSGNTIWESGG